MKTRCSWRNLNRTTLPILLLFAVLFVRANAADSTEIPTLDLSEDGIIYWEPNDDGERGDSNAEPFLAASDEEAASMDNDRSEEQGENDAKESGDAAPSAQTPLSAEAGMTIGVSGLTLGASGSSIAEDVAAIRRNSDIFLYGVIPLLLATGIVICVCRWFSETFIDSIP